MQHDHLIFIFFFFNDTATTEIYTLSLHDALPILVMNADVQAVIIKDNFRFKSQFDAPLLRSYLEQHLSQECGSLDRKSTRLNSSHLVISYAVFCLKKKKTTIERISSANTSATAVI